jgi:hypothetical protein
VGNSHAGLRPRLLLGSLAMIRTGAAISIGGAIAVTTALNS